jgi:hypothetical protein
MSFGHMSRKAFAIAMARVVSPASCHATLRTRCNERGDIVLCVESLYVVVVKGKQLQRCDANFEVSPRCRLKVLSKILHSSLQETDLI